MESLNEPKEQIEPEVELSNEEKKTQELDSKNKPIHVWWKEKPWRP